jgi:DNA-binding response OmpR family regulator
MSRILIADDDETCRCAIQKVLEREGHAVEAASDVDTALAALSGQTFDLIVCDYKMPGKTGLDLLTEIRKQQSGVPVLMISAYTDTETEIAVKELGALGLLRKPFRRHELIDRTIEVVGRRRL